MGGEGSGRRSTPDTPYCAELLAALGRVSRRYSSSRLELYALVKQALAASITFEDIHRAIGGALCRPTIRNIRDGRSKIDHPPGQALQEWRDRQKADGP